MHSRCAFAALFYLATLIQPAQGEGEPLVKPIGEKLNQVGAVNAVALSSDGKYLATGGADKRVHLWEIAKGKEIGEFPALKGAIDALAFARDGKTIASGSADKTVRIWQIDPIKELQKFEMKDGAVNAVAFSPDGKLIASGGADKLIHLWDPDKGVEVRSLKGHENGVTALAFSPNGKHIVSGSKDRTVRVWDADASKEIVQYLVHQGWVLSVAFAPDGQTVASSSRDQSIILFDVVSQRKILRVQTYEGPIPAIAFSPEGKVLASASKDQKVHLWDLFTGKDTYQVAGLKTSVSSVAFCKDGKTLAAGGDDGSAAAWDAEGLLKIVGPHKEELTAKDTTRLWNALGDESDPASYRAIQTLVANPKKAIEYIGGQLKAPASLDRDRIVSLIKSLGSADFDIREKATEVLLAGSELVEKVLRDALKNKPLGAEAKTRVEQILRVMETRTKDGESYRRQMALEILERIGTPEAKDILKALAGGPTEAEMTNEAKTSLERFAQRAAAKP
jgi:WD40 repeat protein